MEAEPETKVVAHDSKAPAEVPSAEAANDPAPDRESERSGGTVGRYQLVHRVGHGGMATVYLGRAEGRAGFEKLVAVKVIHPHLANEPDFVEMFLDEARIAARIHHPHVVEILDLGEADGLSYMVMEYVEGETLSALLRVLRKEEEFLPVLVALQIVTDACEGLAAAHGLRDPDGQPYRLVHRDVSPQNLLVGLDGWVKVVDFGIMKAAGKRSNTLTGQLRGKLPYMSPEQARGDAIDRRTDLFALGTVLWELLTNERLFAAETEASTLELVMRCDVPDIGRFRGDVPVAVREILGRALAPNPDERYGSADELLTDVRAVVRRTSAEMEPRRHLAEIMKRHFGAKAEYARAAVRAGASASVVELPVLPPPEERSQASATPMPHRSFATNPTLTTSIAGAPARHWSLWLLLPLVGAAIGTAVVTQQDKNVAEVAPQEPRQAPQPEPTLTSRTPAAPNVKWLFNTQPQGATIIINGAPTTGTTPLEVEVPRSDTAVPVEIVLAGHETRRIRLAPLKSDNYNLTLERSETPAQPPFVAPAKLTKPGSKRKKPVKAVEGPPNAERPLDPRPDFEGLGKGRSTAHGG